MSALGRTPSVLTQAEFEELDRLGQRVNDALRLEFIGGRIIEQPMPTGDHGRIMQWLTRLCVDALPETWLFSGQGLRVGRYGDENVRPTAVLAPLDHFVGQGEWAEPDGVLMAVDVATLDTDAYRRDREVKPGVYAEAGIPVRLFIDHSLRRVSVESAPADGRYWKCATVSIGETVHLPEPVRMELDTAPLANWVR